MISFVWPPGEPMLAGTGGSETYTAGHVRELRRRGINAQVVTIGHGDLDGRQDFQDIPFVSLNDEADLAHLEGVIVYVNKSYPVPTKQQSAIIFHCSIPRQSDRDRYKEFAKDKKIIATSVYSGQKWALFLDIPYRDISIVLPFADPLFSSIARLEVDGPTRVLFAGRLHPDKGIYTLLEMMHQKDMQQADYQTTIVQAGLHVDIGREIARMLEGYPYARIVPVQKSLAGMAELLSETDILLVPSVFAEPFGMLSVEAQHAGCRVIASNVGGLPETNCGLLTLVAPRSPIALLTGIKQAVALGAASPTQRHTASKEFTLSESVDRLLAVLASPVPI